MPQPECYAVLKFPLTNNIVHYSLIQSHSEFQGISIIQSASLPAYNVKSHQLNSRWNPCSWLKSEEPNLYCPHSHQHSGLPYQNCPLNSAYGMEAAPSNSHPSCKPVLEAYEPHGQVYHSNHPIIGITFLLSLLFFGRTKYLGRANLKEEGVTVAHSLKGYSLW